MSHNNISIAFYVSLFLLLPAGLAVLIFWGKKIMKPIARDIDKSNHISLEGTAFKTFVYMIPALLVFILLSVPVLYFGNLQKKEVYCKTLIGVNNLQPDDPVLKQRCSGLDIQQLFEQKNGN